MPFLHRAEATSTPAKSYLGDEDLSLKEVASSTASTLQGDASFHPSIELQVETPGLDLNNFGCLQNVPTPVYRISAGRISNAPEYVSVRPSRKSNSCALVSGADRNQTPLITTTYRWGPGRNPRMRFLSPSNALTVDEAVNGDKVQGEEFEVKGTNVFSRAKQFETPYGTFEWRYGNRHEKHEAYEAKSLIVLDRLDHSGKHGTRVAQLVRNEDFKADGTARWAMGHGGRLQIDSQIWAGLDKANAKEIEAFIVASCLCMLKKEVDSQRNNQAALLV